jgi:hypothetical protein
LVKKASAGLTFQLSREGIETRIGEMEKKIERLRSMYESFFMGVERIPPNTARREMNRLMLEMQQVPIGNASLRFRFQSLSQKWVLHMTYWNRTMREIEAGTFRRDVARTQRHLAERGGAITEEEALALGIPKNRVKAFVARHQRLSLKKTGTALPAAPGPTSAPPAPAGPTGGRAQPPPIPASARRSPSPDAVAVTPLPGLTDIDFESAYRRYLDAHKKLGREAEALPKDKIRARLGKQLPKILEDKKCDRVQLDVAVEGDKVRLRAWPADSKS